MEQWEVQRGSGSCAGTNRELMPNEEYYAALVDCNGFFERRDYCQEYWLANKPEVFSFWKTVVPQPNQKKKLLVDDAVLINFFERLADETEQLRINFRFVLGLILMRKRILKYEDTKRDGDTEVWRMRRAGTPDIHKVVNPQLDEAQIQEVSNELTSILRGEL